MKRFNKAFFVKEGDLSVVKRFKAVLLFADKATVALSRFLVGNLKAYLKKQLKER